MKDSFCSMCAVYVTNSYSNGQKESNSFGSIRSNLITGTDN